MQTIMKTETYYQFVDGKLVEAEDPMPKDGYDNTPLAMEDPEDEDGWPSYSMGGAMDIQTVFKYPKGSDPTIEYIEAYLTNTGETKGHLFITDEISVSDEGEPTGTMFMANVFLYED